MAAQAVTAKAQDDSMPKDLLAAVFQYVNYDGKKQAPKAVINSCIGDVRKLWRAAVDGRLDPTFTFGPILDSATLSCPAPGEVCSYMGACAKPTPPRHAHQGRRPGLRVAL